MLRLPPAFRRFLPALALLVLAAFGCSSSPKGTAKLPEGVAATVDGASISDTDVQQLVHVLQQQGFVPDSTTAGATPEEKQRNFALDRLVDRQVILNEARKAKVMADTSEIEQRWQMFKMQMGLTDSVAPPGIDLANLKKNLGDDLTISKYFDKTLVDTIRVTGAEVEAYYNANPEQFTAQDQVHARHILFLADQSADAARKADARKKAEGVLAQIKAGKDFAELAEKNSEDPGSAKQGGDLGFFQRGQMVPSFEQAAFALEAGQISDVVESPFGYHIIKVEEKKAGSMMALEQVKPGIEEALKNQRAQAEVKKRVDTLKLKARVLRAAPAAAEAKKG